MERQIFVYRKADGAMESALSIGIRDNVLLIRAKGEMRAAGCRNDVRKLHGMDKLSVMDGAVVPPVTLFGITTSPGDFNSRDNIELIFKSHTALNGLHEKNRREFQELRDEMKMVPV